MNSSVLARRPRFWLRTSISVGNVLQLAVTALGAALLIAAARVAPLQPSLAVGVMVLGWLCVYVSSHAIAHWAVGRVGGIRFVGYGISGTDHPEIYPPGVRQIFSALPFFTAITDQASLARAGRWSRALMFGAGVTSTTLSSIVFAALALALGIPGARPLLTTTVLVAVAATVVTARVPRGDYAKARLALRLPSKGWA